MTDLDFDVEFASPAQWAAMYRAKGLQVIPCYTPHEQRQWKRPSLKDWTSLQENLVPDATFERWYGDKGEHARRRNMGIITGRASGCVFVIDLDDYKSPAAANWWRGLLEVHNNGMEPETWQQKTGGGGRQLLFKGPPGWVAPTNRTAIDVDIRGQGGFAVMPSTLHESGVAYEWKPGCAPWEIEISDAPGWLIEAIDTLVREHGGKSETAGPVERVEASSDFDSFGNRTDGRDFYMRDMIWAAVVSWYRECPIPPPEAESMTRMMETWEIYESHVRTRFPGSNAEGLEREGRGMTAFLQKWRRAMSKWSTDVHEAAKIAPIRPEPVRPEPPRADPEAIKAAAEKAEKKAENDASALFEFLSMSEIMNMKDPDWLIDGLVIDEALGFLYGPPGCLKTFIALSMALSFAHRAVEWWGRKIHRNGTVVYISSEGQSDLKFRIQAWEQKFGIDREDGNKAPFFLIRQTINFMKAEDVGKLLATVQAIIDKTGKPVAAVFVDTVSRVLPGADENLQKDMTLFVAACDAVRMRFHCTVMGVHHTSRNGNMRGSTVFPGAGDFLIEVNREEGESFGYIKAVKIKAAEDGWEQAFKAERIPCGDVGGHESLVVEASQEAPAAAAPQDRLPDRTTCQRILNAIGEAWRDGNPWSIHPQSQRAGRFAPRNISRNFQIDQDDAQYLIEEWQSAGIIRMEEYSTNRHIVGLKVLVPTL